MRWPGGSAAVRPLRRTSRRFLLVSRRACCAGAPLFGDGAMLNLIEFEPGATVPLHSHPHEQLGIVLRGMQALVVDGVARELGPLEGYVLPGGVEHSAYCGPEGALVLDVFAPVREDYLRALDRARREMSRSGSTSPATSSRRLAAEDPTGRALTFVDAVGAVRRLHLRRAGRSCAAHWSGLLAERGCGGATACSSLVGKTPDWHADPARRAAAAAAVTIPCPELLRAKDLDVPRCATPARRLLVADRGAEAEVEAMVVDTPRRRLPRRGRVAPRATSPAHRARTRTPTSRRSSSTPRARRRTRRASRTRTVHVTRSGCRPSTGSTRGPDDLVWCTAGTGWAKSIWNVLPRPVEPRRRDPPPRGAVRRARAVRAARAPRGDGALPGADRVPADGEARRPRSGTTSRACAMRSPRESRSTPR